MEISIVDSDPKLSELILNNLNKIFVNKSIRNNSKQARASIDFLNEQLEIIEASLRISETKLTNFQEENLFFQQGEEGKNLLLRLREMETQLNELQLEEVRIKEQYNPASLAFQSFMNQKEIISQKVNEIKAQISNLPNLEQSYINLLREVEINQQTLEEILNKKIEFSISEASTLSDINIIVKPFTDINVVSPIPLRYIFLAILFSAFFSFIFILIKVFLFAKFRLPDEIQELTDKRFLGVLPNLMETDNFEESINTVITNLTSTLEQDKKVIMISGALKGIGKTTTSINIAKSLSGMGFKVLLMDCDMRRGDIHIEFNLHKGSLTDIQDFNEDKFKQDKNLFVIPRIREASDAPLSYFNSPNFKKLIKKNRDNFDYIIIDTPPVLAVSDALLILRFSDVYINVVRHNYTKHRDLLESIDMISSVSNIEQYVVYNDFKKQFGYYGYDYYTYRYYNSEYKYESSE